MKLRNKKTGKMGETRLGNQEIYVDTGDKTYCYVNDIDAFCKEWEYVMPDEPLIKDKKIRKAVRAWAEVNSIEEVLYAERPNMSLCNLTDMGDDDYDIEFVGWIPTLKDGDVYTIAELCGEEEE